MGCVIPIVILLLVGGGIIAAVISSEAFYLWDSVGGPPVFTEIGGRTMVVGRVRTVRDNDQLYIQGTWADTAEQAWRYGPLGSYSDSMGSVRHGVSGGRVVVSGPGSQISTLDPSTGARLTSAALSDAVEKICVTTDPNQVIVEQVDDRIVLLDVSTGAIASYQGSPVEHCSPMLSAVFISEDEGPTLEGHRLKRTWNDGRLGVAVFEKHPGTPIPYAAGYDPATNALTWRTSLSTSDPVSVTSPGTNDFPGTIAAGRFLAVYGVGSEVRRLTCLDAQTGNRLWDVKLEDIFAVDWINQVSASGDHVFVERTSSMDIFRLADGAQVGTIGDETYE